MRTFEVLLGPTLTRGDDGTKTDAVAMAGAAFVGGGRSKLIVHGRSKLIERKNKPSIRSSAAIWLHQEGDDT
jgi:hypothetical protein